MVEDVESMSLTEGVEGDVRLATADISGDGVDDDAITPTAEVVLAAAEDETTLSADVVLILDIATAEDIGKSDVDCTSGYNDVVVTGIRYVSFDDEVVATDADVVVFSEGIIGRLATVEEVFNVLKDNITEDAVFVSTLAVVAVVLKCGVDAGDEVSRADVEIMLATAELLNELKLPENGVLDNIYAGYGVDGEESTPGAVGNVTLLSVDEVITVDV